MRRGTVAIAAVGGLAAAAAGYWYGLRPRMLRWGATEAEARGALPGDELAPEPKLKATHAVTIEAPPESVWPWLAQLGQGRGGFYSYEWIENLLGLDIRSADRVLPEFQNLRAGDSVPLAPKGADLPVAILEPNRTLVLHGDTREAPADLFPGLAGPGEYLNVVWGFHLFPAAEGRTRLVERWLVDWSPSLQNTLAMRGFMEPGAFVMERKMLLGIKERAEAAARPPDPEAMFKTPAGREEYLRAYRAALALWPVEVESFEVSTNNGLTHVNACGPRGAPPLVLLPGYGFSSTIWHANVGELSRAYRVYALDVMGDAGLSVYRRPMADRRAYAEWLGEALDALGLPRANLAGQSFGGFLALNFAMAAPERVDRLALLAPAASFAPLRPEFWGRTLAAVALPWPAAAGSLARWTSAGALAADAPVVQAFALALRQFRWGSRVTPTVFSDEELRRVKAPALLLLGEEEVVYDPARVLARAARTLPDVRARILPGAGHVLQIDRPDLVNAELLRFLGGGEQAEEERAAEASIPG